MQSTQLVQQLLAALKGLIDLYENPASFSGKTGEQRMLMLESQAAKSHAAIHQARQAIAAAEQAQADDSEPEWRRLALQFDGHRMQALAHLRCLLENPEKHAEAVRAFLAAPPLSGEQVLAERIAEQAQPRCACGDSFTSDAVCANCLAAQQQSEPEAREFFAYDPECGFETFRTEAEAKKYAQDSIDSYREEASEGWPELVNNICWGVVLGATREVELPDEYNGCNGLAGYMKPVDYVLTDAAQPPAVADRDAIRRVFMAHGFMIKDGQTDLKPYVYEAAEALLRELSPAVAVPEVWRDAMERAAEDLEDNNCLESAHQLRAMLAAAPQAADPIKRLIAMHNELLGEYPYCYFELAYTRRTDWMAWLCTKPRDDDPERKVLACGQGMTAEEACAEAISAAQKGGEA